MKTLRMLVILSVVAGTAGAQDQRVIKKEVVVNAPVAEAWKAWTTTEGVETFFAPKASISLEPGGSYDLLFMPTAPKGSRGCEGCKVIDFEAMRTLILDWGVPATYPKLQNQRGKVTVSFTRVDETHVRVSVIHAGLGSGPEWDEVFKHFDYGWGIVLSRLQQRFQTGPLDWQRLGQTTAK